MTKQQQLEALRQEILDAGVCAELAAGATQLVMGDGSADAQIVFIGEAPGKQEDLQGLPFVGASGKFLNSMLESAGLVRSDVYITNIVKYRPPNNRDPKPEEKEACKEWLHAELAAINPKLIVFLGRHSMNHFFPELKISEAHGKLITRTIPGIKTMHFLPLYHPAAALYNGGLRAQLLADFATIPSLLKKIS